MSKHAVFVTPSLDPLGNAGQLPFWIETLQAAGWRVTLIALRERATDGFSIRYPGVELHCLGLQPRQWSRWRELKRLVGGLRADILHLWACQDRLIWWLGQALGGPSAKLVLTSFAVRQRPLLAAWREPRHPDSELVFDPDLVSGHSPRQTAESSPNAAGRIVTLMPKAIPRTLERRALTRARLQRELGLPGDDQLVVAAADLQPETHCKDLIWGIDQLKIIRDDIHLLLLGSGPQRDRLERFLSLTEAESRTHFLGTRPDGPEIVAAADIFWQADLTRYLPEGLLLALACGVPVVSAYGPNTEAVVSPQQTAWVADSSARYQYARWSKFFLEEPERAVQLARQASEQMERSCSTKAAADRILEVYSELVSPS
ncbi:MAG: glycosyltransferase [Blastopirellula sp.]|nr:glycosyltransferase [Blastopirellula sp.]